MEKNNVIFKILTCGIFLSATISFAAYGWPTEPPCTPPVPRIAWRAKPTKPGAVSHDMKKVSKIIIQHSPLWENCPWRFLAAYQCWSLVNTMQEMDQGPYKNPDTRYNFFLGSDSLIYEGTGWTTYMPKKDKKGAYIARMCIVGDITPETHPTMEMLEALFKFLDCEQEKGRLTRDYTISVGSRCVFEAIHHKKDQYKHILNRVRERFFGIAYKT